MKEETQKMIGKFLLGGEERDAIHIAVSPAKANEELLPGQPVGFVRKGDTLLVGKSDDPFGMLVARLEAAEKERDELRARLQDGGTGDVGEGCEGGGTPGDSRCNEGHRWSSAIRLRNCDGNPLPDAEGGTVEMKRSDLLGLIACEIDCLQQAADALAECGGGEKPKVRSKPHEHNAWLARNHCMNRLDVLRQLEEAIKAGVTAWARAAR